MYGLSLVTPPIIEPVSIAQAKEFCTIEPNFTLDDALLSGFVTASRSLAETYTRRAFFKQTWRLSLDQFPMFWGQTSVKNTADQYYPYSYFYDGYIIKLPKHRCISVDSITYIDPAGVTQTLDPSKYFVDTDSEPARLIPAPGLFWPTVAASVPGAVKVTFICGSYGDGLITNTCPQNVVTAIALGAAHLYSNREGTADIPTAFFRLLDSERVDVFGSY
jgi:hypothetical protein